MSVKNTDRIKNVVKLALIDHIQQLEDKFVDFDQPKETNFNLGYNACIAELKAVALDSILNTLDDIEEKAEKKSGKEEDDENSW